VLRKLLRLRKADDFREEDIGCLTKPVRIGEWIAIVRNCWRRASHP
jgi:hypothetical protein